ncbi:hypothetical protein RRG08_017066, partial [Elysia crispata]
ENSIEARDDIGADVSEISRYSLSCVIDSPQSGDFSLSRDSPNLWAKSNAWVKIFGVMEKKITFLSPLFPNSIMAEEEEEKTHKVGQMKEEEG